MKMQFKINLIASTGALLGLTYSPTATAQSSVTSERTSSALSGGDISSSDRVVFRGYNEVITSAQISNDEDTLNANFEFNLNVGGEPTVSDHSGVDFIGGSVWNVSLKTKVPLNSSQPNDFVDFKSFGIDGSATLGINYLSISYPSSIALEPHLNSLATRCVAMAGEKWISIPGSGTRNEKEQDVTAFSQAFKNTLASPPGPAPLAWNAVLVNTATSLNTNPFSKEAKEKCHSSNLPSDNVAGIIEYFEINFPDDPTYLEYRKSIPRGTATFAGLEASAGLNRFEFVQNAPFAKSNIDRVGFDINGHYGKLFNDGNTAVRMGAGYTRVFEAQDEITFCQTTTSGMDESCITGQNGRPDTKETGYVELGLRQILKRTTDGSPQIAISPSVTYIIEDKDMQFRLPLYLQRSEKGGLDIGVHAVYNAAKDEFGIGAFVGIPFSLTGR